MTALTAGAQMSGAENVLFDLLAHVQSGGGDVTVLCPEGPLAERAGRRFRHVAIPGRRIAARIEGEEREDDAGVPSALASGVRRGLGVLSRVNNLARTWARGAVIVRREAARADVLLVNSTLALPMVGLAFPLGWGKPQGLRVSWLVHDTIAHRSQRIAALLGGRSTDVAVAVSEPTRLSIERFVRASIVRPNGVDIPPLATRPELRGAPVVGVLAVITEWKGQDVAIEALSYTDGVDLEIAGTPFVGDEEFAERLRRQVAELGLGDRVRFVGHIDKSEAFGRWDALLSPSVFPEAGPLGVLESMAAGIPVIATDHGGSSEYLRDGRGLLVPPRDARALGEAITRVVGDPELASNLGRKARAAASSEYDKSTTIARMWNGIAGG